MDFNMRLRKAGGKILLVPDIVAYYYPQSSLSAFFKKNLLDGFWATMPLQFGSRVFGLRHLIPLAFASSLLTLAALTLVFPFFLWPFLGTLLLYSSVSVYFAARVAAKEGNVWYLLLMPAVFATRHVGYGLGSLYGLLRVLHSGQFWIRYKTGIVYNAQEVALHAPTSQQEKSTCTRQ
jgi:hypothetical protein